VAAAKQVGGSAWTQRPFRQRDGPSHRPPEQSASSEQIGPGSGWSEVEVETAGVVVVDVEVDGGTGNVDVDVDVVEGCRDDVEVVEAGVVDVEVVDGSAFDEEVVEGTGDVVVDVDDVVVVGQPPGSTRHPVRGSQLLIVHGSWSVHCSGSPAGQRESRSQHGNA
jgi:hypothetical protein